MKEEQVKNVERSIREYEELKADLETKNKG